MDDRKLKSDKGEIVAAPDTGASPSARLRLEVLTPRHGDVLRTIPGTLGAERLPTAVDRIDRRVVDELLHLYGQLRERTRQRTPVVQIAGVEGGEGVSTVAALLARIAADISRGPVVLFSDLQPSGVEEPATIARGRLAKDGGADRPQPAEADEGEVFLCPLSAMRSPKVRGHDQASGSTEELIEMLRERCELVLVDAGPVMGSIDNLRDTRSFDGLVLVIEADATATPQAQSAVKRVVGAGGTILGSIVNRNRPLIPSIFLPRR